LPLLSGALPPWRQSFLIEYFSDSVFPRIRTMGYQAVRTERHKYIHYTELSGMDELYDLQADPGETRNLAESTSAQALLTEMQKELQGLLKETGATPATIGPGARSSVSGWTEPILWPLRLGPPEREGLGKRGHVVVLGEGVHRAQLREEVRDSLGGCRLVLRSSGSPLSAD